jgi:hypothetical protein
VDRPVIHTSYARRKSDGFPDSPENSDQSGSQPVKQCCRGVIAEQVLGSKRNRMASQRISLELHLQCSAA